ARPRNENRPQRSACSTDSSRKPSPSPTSLANADTGVSRSASTSRHTGTTVYSRACAANVSKLGRTSRVNSPTLILTRLRCSNCPGRGAVAERPEEAAAAPRVARAAALLFDHEQHDVHVAVVPRVAHV